MKTSILYRLLTVFTGHMDLSNPDIDFATREGLEAHRLGTAVLTFGGDVRVSIVVGSDAVSLGDGVHISTKFLVFKVENVKQGFSDVSTLPPFGICIEASGISCPMPRRHAQTNCQLELNSSLQEQSSAQLVEC